MSLVTISSLRVNEFATLLYTQSLHVSPGLQIRFSLRESNSVKTESVCIYINSLILVKFAGLVTVTILETAHLKSCLHTLQGNESHIMSKKSIYLSIDTLPMSAYFKEVLTVPLPRSSPKR